MKVKNILLITGNAGKASEFINLIDIKELDFSCRSLNIQEIQSFEIEEIGRLKTRAALSLVADDHTYDAILTDDTGLYCEGLNGLPGPFIKWFLEKLGAEGIVKLIDLKQRKTRAVCLLSLGLVASGEVLQFKGEIKGKLVSARGRGGFGWDQVFQPQNSEKTYGEMTQEEKNKISHRTAAVQKLRDWILS